MKIIKLTKGFFSTVDNEDFEELKRYKWGVEIHGNRKYAVHGIRNKTNWRMHRIIMKAKPKEVVDHINHDCLDNRKSNLRICSQSENAKNRLVSKNNRCGYKGVCWCKRYGKWEANIYRNGKNKWLGYFDEIKEAIEAYNKAALEYHKNFAYINKI